jgi:DNA polymerase-1
MARYMVFDLETENYETYKRFANPFDSINYVVARGWKYQGDETNSWSYHTKREGGIHIPEDVTLLVGHNIKFDLLYEWENPELKAFFKRGGRIWDTQYVEYLINGATQAVQMVAMDSIAEKYGGRKKIDEVKALWNMGVKTSQIDKDMLIDYLVGTKAEGRNSGDIGNTEKIFLGQLEIVKKKSMLAMVFARMDGLCATTEMEFNGLKIDVQEASKRIKEINAELEDINAKLWEFLPELPEGLEFNWSSGVHASCIIFGGTIKYRKSAPYIDPKTGVYARKKAFKDEPCGHYTSGKKKGQIRYKKVEVPGDIKMKMQDFTFELPGYTVPDPKWKLNRVDGAGEVQYSTDADTIEALSNRDIPFLKLFTRKAKLEKDLGVYYAKYDEDKKEWQGMLTCVMKDTHIIHHSLHHTLTVTTRLSSSKPNLQNIPKESTSEVKKMFISRFEGGKMIEADYSQLEIVCQGLLSLDKQLIEDLINKIDFHCKRVSAWKGCTYEEALYRCKDETYQDHKIWKRYRTDAKVFSFQRAYGAGAAKISETTGIPIEDVQALIEAEETLYSGILTFNQRVEKTVTDSAVAFRDPIRGFRPFRRGHWQAPSGTIYSFRTYDAPSWLKKRGILDSFMPTELKNYPIQGTGGEIVQIQLGLLWRHFVSNDNYGGRALLCNTVHDCVWIDSAPEVVQLVAADTKRILESVPETLQRLYNWHSPVPFPVEVEQGDNLYTKQVIHI